MDTGKLWGQCASQCLEDENDCKMWLACVILIIKTPLSMASSNIFVLQKLISVDMGLKTYLVSRSDILPQAESFLENPCLIVLINQKCKLICNKSVPLLETISKTRT